MEATGTARTEVTPLHERELRLLTALVSGAELTTAARGLGVSVRTARRTARALEAKLGASTLLQAVYIAAKRGVI